MTRDKDVTRDKEELLTRSAKLSPAKRALLEQRLQGKGKSDSRSDSRSDCIPQRSDAVLLPLSFAQQRLWFLQQLEPDHSFYNEHTAMRLIGSLDVMALEQSLNAIVQRHEALRTTFEPVEGQPVQIITPDRAASDRAVTLSQIDLRHLPEALQKAEVERLSNEQSQCPFNLTQSPLLRWTLLQLDSQHHVLLFTIHHIIFDGWSIDILIRDLSTFYAAFSTATFSTAASRLHSAPELLPELPIQYADFAVWQWQQLQGKLLDSQLAYWKQQLRGMLPRLQLPTNRPRPAVQTYRGATQSFIISQRLTEALKAIGRASEATLFMTLLAAFKTLLFRYTGQDDIIVGSPIANRNRAEVEGLIGVFINSLVLRTSLADNPTFQALLSRVRQVMLEAYTHQDWPFEKLVEELQPERTINDNPLFQVSFTLQNAPRRKFELPDLTIALLEVERTRALLDLRLDVTETDRGLECYWEYSTDLFDAARIQRMSGHFQTLLDAIVANPQQPISALPLLTQSEQQQLAAQNQTQTDYPPLCIHQLFEAQVERTPDAIAVVFADQQISYRELNNRANQLAHYLQNLGVGSEVPVGVCLERSPEMLIALLSILKAGGAYVPLDPSYPQHRLDWMISDSQMPVLLTQQSLLDRFSLHQVQLIGLDTARSAIVQQSRHAPASSVSSSHLVYLIYTSGSTGKPKGVQVLHGSVVNFLNAMQQQIGLIHTDTLLAVTSISFDIAALELFLPLINGARLVLSSRAIASDGEQLSQLLETADATLMQATPAAWRMLLTAGWQGKSNLILLCGGEALSRELAQQLLSKGAALWNLYGPTETTIWSTAYRVDQSDELASILPIGRPIANTQVYLLDQQGQPVPVGVVGELQIGGVGLARGYLNRPDLTAEKFVVHPQLGRLYRTGDLARYRSDGAIEYLGRLDHQVKIRGFRIELGEIETILNQHPQVRESIVVAREEQSGEKRLIAYIVPHLGSPVASRELRALLQEQLPDYMIPSGFVSLEAMPLTPNGKVDRKALPAPTSAQLPSSSVPSTPVEDMLAGIWAKVLGQERIHLHDNFFELGGHSLLATLVISQVRKLFQTELPLRCLFESPTVAALAKEIETAIKTGLGLDAPPIDRQSIDAAIPLSFAQQRMWFLAQLEPDNPFYNIPIAVSLQGQLNPTALEQSFNEILCRHQVLRTHIETSAGQPVAVIASAPALQMSLVDLSPLPTPQREAEIQSLMAAEAQQPFNLQRDLLLRVKLLRLAAEEHILLLTLHHIAADGWSIGVLVQEISALYPAFAAGNASSLTSLPIQYANFAAWQRQWLQGEVLEAQLGYWRQQLADAPTRLELPTDRPRPAIQSYRGKSHAFVIAAELLQALNRLSQQAGCTLFMALLATFTVLLKRYSQSDDILVGTPIANRNRAETESLIGFFVNTLVLRTDLSGNPTLWQLLDRVREVSLGAYAHQDLPFEKLVEELQPQRSLSHTPLFQVMFVLQNVPIPEATLPGLSVKTLESSSGTAQFDLTLSLEETAQGLIGSIEYNCDLFEASTIDRMAGHYQTLLAGIIATPDQRLSQLPMLTQAEQHQLITKWDHDQNQDLQAQCIHQLFEAQAQRTPDAIAVEFAEQKLSYRELNARSNQLAHYLRQLGVGAEGLVGLCVDRSLEMLIGLLGILKAGGAYVPLDPSYPKERMAFMLQETQVPLLLTQQSILNHLPDHQAQAVCLDTDWAAIAQQSQENLLNLVNAENLAYLIYTSGSTGIPKGVMISHGSLVNYTDAIASAYALTPSDRILQFASINFDVAAEEIFPCLMQGATLVLRTEERLSSIADLLDDARRLELTVLNLPTAFWHQVTHELLTARLVLPNAIRLMIIGGERALPEHLKNWQQSGQTARLVNCYGPTEATIGATLCDLSQPEILELHSRHVPIGTPLQGIQTYVLDTDWQPVPIGVPGELYIGGMGVARGYLNRSALTAETFIPNPFRSDGSRLYKTGDWVRYCSGNLEYLGRIDAQVKIRGFRIELGEIEAVLRQHPAVRETVIVDRENAQGDKRLIAYVVAEPLQTPSIRDLRHFLKAQLPEYMVPAVFMPIAALPLTPNGKVDERALPAPDLSRPDLDHAFVAPRTPIETTLAEIWAQVLGLEQVGRHDNFFELGGDSILTIQVVARAAQSGLQLTPKLLFEHQTIAQLAAVTTLKPITQIEQGWVTGAAFLTPIQRWFFEQSLPDRHYFNQAVWLEAHRQIDFALLDQALQSLLVHHDALRLRFDQTATGEWQAQMGLDRAVPLTRWDFSRLTAAEQASALEAAEIELQSSLNLSVGPLVQVGWFDLRDAHPIRLLIVIHHLVVDGISWRILLDDLQTAYQQLSQGQPVELPAKTTSFKQWAEELRNYARSAALQQEQDYWLAVSQPPFTPLPVDESRGENTIASSCHFVNSLSCEETQALLKDVPTAYRTEINDVLLTALVQTFTVWTGEQTLLLDLEGHGRESILDQVDISRTVGWFTTTFPVRLTLNRNPDLGSVLKGVKEQLRSIPNRGIGYGILRYLSDDKQVTDGFRSLPQAEVLFNYLGQFDQSLSESDVFRLASKSSEATQSPRGKRSHLLEINSWILEGQLQLNWSYSHAIHRRSTIETLAKTFLEKLRLLLIHCQSLEAGGYTPSDFSEANLSQQELDQFLEKFNRRG